MYTAIIISFTVGQNKYCLLIPRFVKKKFHAVGNVKRDNEKNAQFPPRWIANIQAKLECTYQNISQFLDNEG